MDASASRMIFVFLDALGFASAFVVLLAAVVVAFHLTKLKQGAAGGWLLVLARAGVCVVAIGYLLLGLLSSDIGLDALQVSVLLLRSLLLIAYLVTIPALLLIRPSEESSHG